MRVLIKIISWVLTGLRFKPQPNIVFLMFHRLTGDTSLEIDLPFSVFEAQMRWLAGNCNVISLCEALNMLNDRYIIKQPTFVITFDDAYLDFYTHAYPLLRELGLPVTLYVPTGFLDTPCNQPISRKVSSHVKLQPVTWTMLAELASCELVTIASHTHSHFELPSLSDAAILEELSRCDTLLEQKLGQKMLHFAYPRGIWDGRVEQLVKHRYVSVALAGGGAAKSENFLPYRIPRIPVLRSDGMRWFYARISGRLIYEEWLVKLIKRLKSKLILRLQK